jgi:mannose-1-phosphate guanylyltransferase/phosphomannomutase
MRMLTERLRDRELDLTDGVKVLDERGWAQVLPDPDEPVVHLYAEGATEELSGELEREMRRLVEEISRASRLLPGHRLSSTG